MTTINFVPNDYIQQRRSSRVNLLYLILLAILLAGIAATFSIIKMRQAGARAELDQLDVQMQQAREEIARLDQRRELRPQSPVAPRDAVQVDEAFDRETEADCEDRGDRVPFLL
jgi:cell division protein FtsB